MRRILPFSLFEAQDTSPKLQICSKQQAIDNEWFGPVYHGTTEDKWPIIMKYGFQVFHGTQRSESVRHGYPNQEYYKGIPPPIHHLGYGIYFTTVKTIAKAFNNNTEKNLKEFYLDAPRLETINFGANRTMMEWWQTNGYDAPPGASDQERVEATLKMTRQLSKNFDAVWFKGKGLRRLLDGDQVCVFDPSRIYLVDKSKSFGYEIGSTVIFNKESIFGPNPDLLSKEKFESGRLYFPGDNIKGLIVSRQELMPEISAKYWGGAKYSFTVKWKKGGTVSNYTEKNLLPV